MPCCACMKPCEGDVGQVTMVMPKQGWQRPGSFIMQTGVAWGEELGRRLGGDGGCSFLYPLRPTSFIVDVRLH